MMASERISPPSVSARSVTGGPSSRVHTSRLLFVLLIAAALVSTPPLAYSQVDAQADTQVDAQVPAASPPPTAALAHDSHDGFTIAADPYVSPDRAKATFGKDNPVSAGILPIDVFLTNDTAAALRVQLESIRFEVTTASGGRQELEPLSADEVAGKIAYPSGSATPTESRTRLPLPIPHHDKKAGKIADKLRPLALDADVVAPHATIHGFLFFNVSGQFHLLAGASLYVPDVRAIAGARTFTFFEVTFHTPPTP